MSTRVNVIAPPTQHRPVKVIVQNKIEHDSGLIEWVDGPEHILVDGGVTPDLIVYGSQRLLVLEIQD